MSNLNVRNPQHSVLQSARRNWRGFVSYFSLGAGITVLLTIFLRGHPPVLSFITAVVGIATGTLMTHSIIPHQTTRFRWWAHWTIVFLIVLGLAFSVVGAEILERELRNPEKWIALLFVLSLLLGVMIRVLRIDIPDHN